MRSASSTHSSASNQRVVRPINHSYPQGINTLKVGIDPTQAEKRYSKAEEVFPTGTSETYRVCEFEALFAKPHGTLSKPPLVLSAFNGLHKNTIRELIYVGHASSSMSSVLSDSMNFGNDEAAAQITGTATVITEQGKGETRMGDHVSFSCLPCHVTTRDGHKMPSTVTYGSAVTSKFVARARPVNAAKLGTRAEYIPLLLRRIDGRVAFTEPNAYDLGNDINDKYKSVEELLSHQREPIDFDAALVALNIVDLDDNDFQRECVEMAIFIAQHIRNVSLAKKLIVKAKEWQSTPPTTHQMKGVRYTLAIAAQSVYEQFWLRDVHGKALSSAPRDAAAIDVNLLQVNR